MIAGRNSAVVRRRLDIRARQDRDGKIARGIGGRSGMDMDHVTEHVVGGRQGADLADVGMISSTSGESISGHASRSTDARQAVTRTRLTAQGVGG
jgi:hypothetical protein